MCPLIFSNEINEEVLEWAVTEDSTIRRHLLALSPISVFLAFFFPVIPIRNQFSLEFC